MQKIVKSASSDLEMAKAFQVEELENRLEFGKWSSDVEVEPELERVERLLVDRFVMLTSLLPLFGSKIRSNF